MHLVEIETKLRKDGVIQIPDKELEETGLLEGNEVCLLYLALHTFAKYICWLL